MATQAALYTRISDDQAGEQQATARQRADCIAFAERKGWEVADTFEDVVLLRGCECGDDQGGD